MVTSAGWADVDGDRRPDLVVAGEWMSPQIYAFGATILKRIRTNLDNLYGWWQSVTTADFNGDGKTDLVLGNIGQNAYLRPDSAHPVKIFINDFDNNG